MASGQPVNGNDGENVCYEVVMEKRKETEDSYFATLLKLNLYCYFSAGVL